jgi:hypothetical protein
MPFYPKLAFQVWRDNKKNSKFSSIPSHLKTNARQLLSSYPISQVAVALGVSRSFLYNIQKDQNYCKRSGKAD